jgi:hypothetical protein
MGVTRTGSPPRARTPATRVSRFARYVGSSVDVSLYSAVHTEEYADNISATGDQLPASPPTIRYPELDPTWNFVFDDHSEMTRRLPRLAALYLE